MPGYAYCCLALPKLGILCRSFGEISFVLSRPSGGHGASMRPPWGRCGAAAGVIEVAVAGHMHMYIYVGVRNKPADPT